MTARRRLLRDLLVGVAVSLVALAGMAWQLDSSAARGDAGDVPRLICPLH